MKALLPMITLAAMLLGCSSSQEGEMETSVSAVKFPSNPQRPSEFVGTWMLGTQVMKLDATGEATTIVKIGAQQGMDSKKATEGQEQIGKWAVSGSNFFLEFDGQPPIEYDFKLSGTNLQIGKGKAKFTYTRKVSGE